MIFIDWRTMKMIPLETLIGERRETLIDYRFGFPILLEDVPVRLAHGQSFVNVNANNLQEAVLRELLHRAQPLSGDEVMCVRLCLELSKADFAERCGVPLDVVGAWSRQGVDRATACEDDDATIRKVLYRMVRDTSKPDSHGGTDRVGMIRISGSALV